MSKEALLENVSIYTDNLSLYYISSVVIAILSVIFTWWYHKFCGTRNQKGQLPNTTNIQTYEDDEKTYDETDQEKISDDEIISKIKMGRQSLLAEKIAANLTEAQLQEEREMEKQQLQAIFQLLQNQEDKFQVNSLEELEDQLKLYRH